MNRMIEPLDYSNPDSEIAAGTSGARSFKVGIICWCVIGVCVALLAICKFWEPFDLLFGFTVIFILMLETVLAFYGMLTGFIGWYWEATNPRSIAGTILNLTALAPLVLFLISLAK
jgi:hypothetical protein